MARIRVAVLLATAALMGRGGDGHLDQLTGARGGQARGQIAVGCVPGERATLGLPAT